MSLLRSVTQALLGVLFIAQENWAGAANEAYWVLFHTGTGLKQD